MESFDFFEHPFIKCQTGQHKKSLIIKWNTLLDRYFYWI